MAGTMERQLPLFEADTTFFHILAHMIDSGDAAKMGGTTYLVYSVIKRHTNWKLGGCFPGVELIAEKAGISRMQVNRCLNTLKDMGYISVDKVGRKNRYTLREKVEVMDKEGQVAASATWDYIPVAMEQARAELKNFIMTGDPTGAQIIQIENFSVTLNIQNIEKGDGHIHNNAPDPEQFPFVKGAIAKNIAARKAAKEKNP